MASTQQLLALVRDNADPCETIRQECQAMTNDPTAHLELKQASQDMAETIQRIFQIARYIMEHPEISR